MAIKFNTLHYAGTSGNPADKAGVNGNIIWVLDVATPLWESAFTDNDATFAIEKLHEALSNVAVTSSTSLRDFLTTGIRTAREEIERQYPDFFRVSPQYRVTFSVAVARVNETEVEYLLLGDNILEYELEIGEHVARSFIKDHRIDPFKAANKALIANVAKDGKREEAYDEEVLEIYREARLMANTPGGYPIASFEVSDLDEVLEGVFFTTSQDIPFTVAVYTNGFERRLPGGYPARDYSAFIEAIKYDEAEHEGAVAFASRD